MQSIRFQKKVETFINKMTNLKFDQELEKKNFCNKHLISLKKCDECKKKLKENVRNKIISWIIIDPDLMKGKRSWNSNTDGKKHLPNIHKIIDLKLNKKIKREKKCVHRILLKKCDECKHYLRRDMFIKVSKLIDNARNFNSLKYPERFVKGYGKASLDPKFK